MTSGKFPDSFLAGHDRLDWRIMVETKEVTELAEGLHRVLSKLVSVLRRGDTSRVATGDLTLAQLSILLTLHRPRPHPDDRAGRP